MEFFGVGCGRSRRQAAVFELNHQLAQFPAPGGPVLRGTNRTAVLKTKQIRKLAFVYH
jgi:hypothetical protein